MLLQARNRTIRFPRRPLVMGIVNLSVDSFSGDGLPDAESALARAREMLAAGADLIDIGAESARAGIEPIAVDVEIGRLLPFVENFSADAVAAFSAAPYDDCQLWPPLLSVNTWRPEVTAAVLPAGGDILNDIGALPDAANARLCAEAGAALVIMHSAGPPKQARLDQTYPDIWEELERFFGEKMALAQGAGLEPEQIVLDPGIDFAKQRDDNLRVYRELDRLQSFQRPVLLPVSRKTVVGEVLGLPRAADRDAGTIACIVSGVLRGAHILRVHNVPAAIRSVKVLEAVIPSPAE